VKKAIVEALVLWRRRSADTADWVKIKDSATAEQWRIDHPAAFVKTEATPW
jgi:hypothetical protein